MGDNDGVDTTQGVSEACDGKKIKTKEGQKREQRREENRGGGQMPASEAFRDPQAWHPSQASALIPPGLSQPWSP
jgi:hypothetical protein